MTTFVVSQDLVEAWDREVNDDPLLSLRLYVANQSSKTWSKQPWLLMSSVVGIAFPLIQGWVVLKIQVRQGYRTMAEGQLLYNPTTAMTMVIPGKGRSDALLAISLIDNKEVDYRPDGMIPEDYYTL